MAWEDEGPSETSAISQAELTLQHLLQKQLATSGRLERVDFNQAVESMQCIGHSSSGIATREQFCEAETRTQEALEAHRLQHILQYSKGGSKSQTRDHFQRVSSHGTALPAEQKVLKRKGYGAHPDSATIIECLVENSSACEGREQEDDSNNGGLEESPGRHKTELEATLVLGKDKLRRIAHLSEKDILPRQPLHTQMEHGELCLKGTPQERAQFAAEEGLHRTVAQVFSCPAPPVLDLYTYLQDMKKDKAGLLCASLAGPSFSTGNDGLPCAGTSCSPDSLQNAGAEVELKEVSLSHILENRLLEHEIRALRGGKFSNYSPGEPSDTLYIKNVSPEATEQDLVSIFIRFQKAGQHLIFRLMKNGRMRGQAFVTFPDKETASAALETVNGYKLKNRHIIIQFGRQSCNKPNGLA